MKEHVAWRIRHKNDGAHMWEYYPSQHSMDSSPNIVMQKLTINQLLDILNDDKHAGSQERPPEPHSESQTLVALATAVLAHAPDNANEFMGISLDDIGASIPDSQL